jgi:hypothetical protein
MATAKGEGKRRRSKPTQSLEASLEELQKVAKNFKTSKPKKLTKFFNSYDGSGKKVPSGKGYKYRSTAERASKQRVAKSTPIEGSSEYIVGSYLELYIWNYM